MNLLTYLFWPNPGTSSYTSPTVLVLLLVSLGLILASFAIRYWRANKASAVERKLSRSWPAAALWLGVVGLILTVARVEGIQYIGMRVWWIVWAVAGVAFAALQWRLFRTRHYEVVPMKRVDDPRDRYLPRKKKR